jgi:hypothetical protein
MIGTVKFYLYGGSIYSLTGRAFISVLTIGNAKNFYFWTLDTSARHILFTLENVAPAERKIEIPQTHRTVIQKTYQYPRTTVSRTIALGNQSLPFSRQKFSQNAHAQDRRTVEYERNTYVYVFFKIASIKTNQIHSSWV